jgi:hypothetical protein
MPRDYPWYESVTDPTLRQGDIFFDFPVFVAKADASVMKQYLSGKSKVNFGGTVLKMDVVVASQSCDLDHDKVKTVILCPIWDLNHVREKFNWDDEKLENVRTGRENNWHMVHASDDPAAEMSVIEFRRVYTTTKKMLMVFAEKNGSHVRLMPPYREHFSQSFGRYFMRVALPIDIPTFAQPEAG